MLTDQVWRRISGFSIAYFMCVVTLAYGDEQTAEKPKESEKEINVGDDVPLVHGMDDRGKDWKIADHLGKKNLVIYFYPADFTVGCSKQAASFRDGMNELANHDVEVIGVSGDSVKNHEFFKREWSLNFTLLSDEGAEIAHDFGVPVRRGGRAIARGSDGKLLLDENGEKIFLHRNVTFLRWMYIIGKNGKIVFKNKNVRPAQASDQVLKFLDQQTEK